MKQSIQKIVILIFTFGIFFNTQCFSATERESIMNNTHTLSWAYYTGDDDRWYISTTLKGSSYFNNIYSLMPIKNNAGWGTVAENSIVLDTINNQIMVDNYLDRDTSNYYYDIGWREWVEDDLIVQDRTCIQGKNEIIKWYFFYVEGTGRWYIINTPEYYDGISILKFASKDGQYDWIETDTNDLQPIFFTEDQVPKIKFEQNAIDLWQPCSSCDYPGPYDREWHGDNTNHLGQDYPAYVGNDVRAVADGKVYAVYDSIGGFGGGNPSRTGPAIVIKHKKKDGTIFFALYGHTSSNLSENSFVEGNEIIGQVEDYIYGSEHWPHLHFGIWDAEDNFPTIQLGYGSDRNFVNPVPFLEDTQYQTWTE